MSKEIKVVQVNENDPTTLYHRYPGQSDPQPVNVELDLQEGRLSIDWDGEIGNAMSLDVFHNRTRRYAALPYSAQVANALLADLAPLAAELLSEVEIVWNGRNRVAEFSDAAERIEERIEEVIRGYSDEQQVVEFAAEDWFQSPDCLRRIEEIGFGAFAEEVAAEVEDPELYDGNLVVISGIEGHLDWLRIEFGLK